MSTSAVQTGVRQSVTYIRVAALTPFIEHLQNAGVSPATLLDRHAIPSSQLGDPYALIPLHHFVAFLEDAAAATGDDAFGAKLGAHLKPADIGPMGILFSVSPTIHIALQRIARLANSLQGATNSGVVEEDGTLTWSYALTDRTIWPRRQDAEYSMAATCELVRSCFRANLNPLEVHFEHERPAKIEPLKRIFRAPILFSQSSNRLIYDVEETDRVYRSEDKFLIATLERHLADLISEMKPDDGVSEKVTFLIQLYLGRRPVTTTFLAQELGMSLRTLQRRLDDEGTSVRALIRKHRSELAAGLLERPDTRAANVALALGYADGAAFSRAFKDWTGQSPRAARPQRSRKRQLLED
ncbi:AraC family transcriptional regulator [Ciceribacter sp. RN22]|uniref:AraC family transcriptional regulator n=1 Tax=Ciceribacter sp. RN22 TaxID=2954932 RepID=UPI00209309B4|nr:AraC family transcriptional regulator [Ciceribacter sp. RN22]MCO6181073.1 AraC family transcriptional regulator [Ciceribacter sp. RN22]